MEAVKQYPVFPELNVKEFLLAGHTTTDAELTLREACQTVFSELSGPLAPSFYIQRLQVCWQSGCESDVHDVLIFKAGKRLHIGLCAQRDREWGTTAIKKKGVSIMIPSHESLAGWIKLLSLGRSVCPFDSLPWNSVQTNPTDFFHICGFEWNLYGLPRNLV